MLQHYNNGSRRAITGAGLAQLRRRLTASERAVLGADIVDGRIVVVALTTKAIAALVGVSVGYIDHALRLTPEQRAEVCRGDRPLVSPRPPCADFEALVEAIRRAGLDRTLEAAVEAERATT